MTGWKLVHGDIFRKPILGYLFAPLVGSGVQLLFMILSLLILAAVGILNPSYRGGFMSFALFLFAFAGYAYLEEILTMQDFLWVSQHAAIQTVWRIKMGAQCSDRIILPVFPTNAR